MSMTLRWRATSTVPSTPKGLDPGSLVGSSAAEVARRRVWAGNEEAEVGDLFAVEGDVDGGSLTIEGDLTRVHRLGRRMASGTLAILGDAGHGVRGPR